MMLTGIKNSILDMGLFANKWGHCNKERSCFTASEMFSISNYRYLFISFPASFHIFSSKKKKKISISPDVCWVPSCHPPSLASAPVGSDLANSFVVGFFRTKGVPVSRFGTLAQQKTKKKKTMYVLKNIKNIHHISLNMGMGQVTIKLALAGLHQTSWLIDVHPATAPSFQPARSLVSRPLKGVIQKGASMASIECFLGKSWKIYGKII